MRILVTGITGQIGSYCAEQLLAQGHRVTGLVRGQKTPRLPAGIGIVHGDLLDEDSLVAALRDAAPDRIYNFAAATAIGLSWQMPSLMASTTGLGVLRLLNAVRRVNPGIRVVQASSADQYGEMTTPADESTPFAPRSPYGVAKQFAHDICLTYREAFGMHISTAIQFNVTSPRHGDEFVVRKVTQAAVRIAYTGDQSPLYLGWLDAQRDWGHAADTARAYPMIADEDEPGDYVLATGRARALRDLLDSAFGAVDLNWTEWVVASGDRRPLDVAYRCGDSEKAFTHLSWTRRYDFGSMILEMVQADKAKLTEKRRSS